MELKRRIISAPKDEIAVILYGTVGSAAFDSAHPRDVLCWLMKPECSAGCGGVGFVKNSNRWAGDGGRWCAERAGERLESGACICAAKPGAANGTEDTRLPRHGAAVRWR